MTGGVPKCSALPQRWTGVLSRPVGLRNGDPVRTVNGEDLTTWAGAEMIFNSFLAGTSTLNVTATRGSSTVNLTWTLVP